MGTGTQEAAPEQELSTDDMLRQLLKNQAEDRKRIADLHEKVNAQKAPAPQQSSTVLSDEELQAQRAEEIGQHDFYCPACGLLYDYQRECTGRPEAPHTPLDVISTDELKGDDADKHTAAPNTNLIG